MAERHKLVLGDPVMHVDRAVVALLVFGGMGGALIGIALGRRMAGHTRLMEIGFALIVIAVGVFMAFKSLV